MKENPIFRILVYFSIISIISSCEKDELTKPAPVTLELAMEEDEVPFQEEEGKRTHIKIENARYRFSSMDFEGYRQVGDDYFFSKEFVNGLEVGVESDKSAEVVEFDMPQGEYEQVKISLNINKSAAEESGAQKGEKKSTPYQDDAGIIMEGYYTNTRKEQVPLVFVYDFDETFEFTTQQGTVNSSISVSKEQNNLAIIRFDAVYWMQLINGRMLQSAKLTEVNGVPTIIISADHNEHIFNLLTSRIKNASKLTFN